MAAPVVQRSHSLQVWSLVCPAHASGKLCVRYPITHSLLQQNELEACQHGGRQNPR